MFGVASRCPSLNRAFALVLLLLETFLFELGRTLLLRHARLLLLGRRLLGERLSFQFVCLGFLQTLNQYLLVLELVTLRLHIELMINVIVDLLCGAVLTEKAAQDTLTAHPENLDRHACLQAATALASARMPTLALGRKILAHACARVNL